MMGQKERAEPLLKVCVPHIPVLSPTLPGNSARRGSGPKGGTLRNGRSAYEETPQRPLAPSAARTQGQRRAGWEAGSGPHQTALPAP